MTKPLSYIALDVETTGITPADDHIVEIAVMRVIDGEITTMFNTLVAYDGEWNDILQKGHHNQDDLRKGMSPKLLADILWTMLDIEEFPLVAYNALFDLEFIYHLFKREISEADAYVFEERVQFFDPLTIARDRFSYPHKLGDMCKKLGIPLVDAHMAYDDCEALVLLTNKLHEQKDITDYHNIAGYKEQYGEPTWVPLLATKKAQGNVTINHTTGKKAMTQGKPFARLAAKK